MATHPQSAIKTDYPFLAHPPPQKKRVPLPLPSPFRPSNATPPCGPRRRSFSAITAWAAHVQPGSPGSFSPCSPRRRRSSLGKGRRPSTASVRAASGSFLHIAPTPTTATPSIRDFKGDLTSLGYTSVFLHLPDTPVSATLTFSVKPCAKNIPVPPVPSPSPKPRGLSRFRSFSVLRSRGRSKSICSDTPEKMRAKATTSSATVAKRKKAKYATLRPPPLVNELALMQFADGGSMDDNIKRLMESQAKASGAIGLGDVFRDGPNDIWWDQDEEWEYAHLLADGDESRPHATGDPQWVTFSGNMSPSTKSAREEERRGSVSTQNSDLDPNYIIRPSDGQDLAPFGGTSSPLAMRKSRSVLAIPCRPGRAAKHLRKPDFLTDVAFSRLCASPKSSKFPSSSGIWKPKGKARRRPAPLKLSPPSPGYEQLINSPIDAEKVRKDFIESSFNPTTPVAVATTPVDIYAQPVKTNRAPWQTVSDGLTSLGASLKRKPSVLNTIGLFRARKEDLAC